MEPPAKRLRLSPRDGRDTSAVKPKAELEEKALGQIGLVPTRTLDLRDFDRRLWKDLGAPSQQHTGNRLLPRAPDVTITANLVNIVVDGSGQTSYTQITAPTSDLVIPISSVGTVTVPGIGKASDLQSISAAPASGPATGLSGGSGTGSILTSLTSTNTTSSTDRTVTVTSVSTLHVSLKNGTVTLTSASQSQTVIIGEGFTTTLDDASTQIYRFGDSATSTPAYLPSNIGGPTAATTDTSSVSSPTATPSSGPGIVLTVQQQQMVGGLVGGVAGVALILLGILYFIKWYRQRFNAQGQLSDPKARHRQLPSGDDHVYTAKAAAHQSFNSSVIPVAALTQSLQRLRSHSANTFISSATDRSSVRASESERGFQRVSGRKIASVLLTGGNEYGEQVPMTDITEKFPSPPSHQITSINSNLKNQNEKNLFNDSSITTPKSGYTTPVRSSTNPFVDPPGAGQDTTPPSMAGPSTSIRDFTAFSPSRSYSRSKSRSNSRSHLTIQTAGLSALNPNRTGDVNILIRPSPARTPTTASPTSSLRQPMQTPPLMSNDIPEMPPLQPWRQSIGPRKPSDDALSVPPSVGHRSMSAISVRSSTSVGGKFREEI